MHTTNTHNSGPQLSECVVFSRSFNSLVRSHNTGNCRRCEGCAGRQQQCCLAHTPYQEPIGAGTQTQNRPSSISAKTDTAHMLHTPPLPQSYAAESTGGPAAGHANRTVPSTYPKSISAAAASLVRSVNQLELIILHHPDFLAARNMLLHSLKQLSTLFPLLPAQRRIRQAEHRPRQPAHHERGVERDGVGFAEQPLDELMKGFVEGGVR